MTETQDAKTIVSTFRDRGVDYPLFPFDKPVTVALPNGTTHYFRMWDKQTEKRREDLLKTVVVTSPAVLHGENPFDAKTDYTRSFLKYYEMMIEGISGVGFNGHKATDVLNAQETVTVDGREARIYELVGVPVRKAAASRLYGGKVDVDRPEAEDEDGDAESIDPFEDLTGAVNKEERRKDVYQLTLNREIVVRQEFGVERLKSGQMTDATHVILYKFREPLGEEFSKWELKAQRGFSISLNKGGTRSERFFNLDTIESLFDSLIENIEGASLHGQPIVLSSDREDASRQAQLALVPLMCKKVALVALFSELTNLGNF